MITKYSEYGTDILLIHCIATRVGQVENTSLRRLGTPFSSLYENKMRVKYGISYSDSAAPFH